jgi:hypothetical protein
MYGMVEINMYKNLLQKLERKTSLQRRRRTLKDIIKMKLEER